MTMGFATTRAGLRPLLVAVLSIAALLLMGAEARAGSNGGPEPTPVIFVHGNNGSAQQFESDAMRFTSNGFPQDRLYAYEYDSLGASNDAAIAGLDPFIANVKQETGASQVDILAHSRGTTVMHAYLSTPERAANVRRYVNFDGRTSAAQPGGVTTMAIWGEGDQSRAIGGAENLYFPNRGHTEVTTSAASFARVYEFLLGEAPETKAVVPEDPKRVRVSGRALDFPTNTGMAGGLLEVYELESKTGQRKSGRPIYSATLDASGDFGPIRVDGRKHYEFAVSNVGETTIHNYPEPFERSDHFYRVLNAPLLASFIERSPDHSTIAVTRMREFWGDQTFDNGTDRLEFNGYEAISAATAPRNRRVIAVFAFDKGSDGVSDTSASLSPFNSIPFLTGVDVAMEASPDASGKIAVTESMRGNRVQSETINVPNWPSNAHTISVFFRDYRAKVFKEKKGKKG